MSRLYVFISLFLICTLSQNLSYGQTIVSLGCQGSGNGDNIDLDRNDWNSGSTANHSEGYALNFDLPSQVDPCTKITKLIVTVTVNDNQEALPPGCTMFAYFENMYLSAGSLSFSPASEYPFSNINGGSDAFGFDGTFEIDCSSNPMSFDGQFGYDLIPAIGSGCNQMLVSNGNIFIDYSVCVEAEIDALPSSVLADADAVNSTVCEGDDIELLENDPNNVMWDWSGPNGFSSSSMTPVISPSTAADEGLYIVTVTDASGCTATDEVDITIGAAPFALAGTPDDMVCEGQEIMLEETGGDAVDWMWDGPAGFSDGNQNPTIPSSTAANLGIYTVTVTDANGCTSTSEIEIFAGPQPQAMADAISTQVCPGQDIELLETAGDAVSWMWDGPAGFSDTSQNPTITGSTSASLGTYTVTITDANGCTNSSDIEINAAPPPSANANVFDDELCPGQDIILMEDAGDGVSWMWDGPAGFSDTAQNPTINNSTSANYGDYTVTVTDAIGCTATSIISISQAADPNADAEVLNDEICPGQAIELEETGGDGISWNWSGPSFNSSAQNPIIDPSTANDLGTYTVTVTDADGCTASSSVDVFPGTPPSVNAIAIQDEICTGQDIELDENGGDGDSWNWSGPDNFSSTDQDPTINNATGANLGLYTVTVTNANGCTAIDDVEIFAASIPNAMATAVSTTLCPGDNIELNETGGDADFWMWSGPDNFNSTDQDPTITNTTSNNFGTYTVTVTDFNGCTSSSSIAIMEATPPTVNASAVVTSVCPGDDISLNETGGGTSWSWTGPNGFTSTMPNPIITNSTAANIGTYTVTVTDASGCTGTGTVEITAGNCACSISNLMLSSVTCNDSNTPSDDTDDFISFSLNPQAVNGGTTYTVTIAGTTVTPGTGTYGSATAFQLPAGSAGAGNLMITVTDANDPNCTEVVSITDPGTCSGTCNLISALAENFTCNDNGTATDDTDDYVTFTVDVTATNSSAMYTISISGANTVMPTTGTYGTPNSFQLQPGSAGQGPLTFTITDSADANCTISSVTIDPGSCSGACDLTAAMLGNVSCDQNNTPDDETDDLISFDLNPTGINLGTMYQVTVASGTVAPSTGTYGSATTFQLQPGSAGGGNVTLTITDGADGTCTIDVPITDPGSCADCPSPPTVSVDQSTTEVCPGDDINLVATGTMLQYAWTGPNGFTSTDQNPIIPNSTNADLGDYTVVATDQNGCTAMATVTVMAGNCSCTLSDLLLSALSCDENGTASDDTDDFITFVLDPQVINGGQNYTVVVAGSPFVVTPMMAMYGGPTTFQLPAGSAGAGDIMIIVADESTDCELSTTLTDPGTCSGACTIQNIIPTDIICNQNNTPDDNADDFISFNLTVTGINSSGDFIIENAGGTITPAVGNFGVPTDFELNAGTAGGGNVTLTITDSSDPNCTVDVVITDPGSCADCPNPPVVTLSLTTTEACDSDGLVMLTGNDPPGGNFSGPGVIGGDFDPATAGTGTHMITYNFVDSDGCSAMASDEITVLSPPDVMLDLVEDATCVGVNLTLAGGMPAGGVYSGDGVNGDTFEPSANGMFDITYTYEDANGCMGSAVAVITVSDGPTATLALTQTFTCMTDVVTLEGGDPLGGDYGGPGVMGNTFDPNVTGPGTFTITYSILDPVTGCTGVASDEFRVIEENTSCDDGDCSNGVEIWNSTICDCEATDIPDPTTCVDDNDCTNGTEQWNNLTCECDTLPEILGCTDPTSDNYDPLATCDDGSCTGSDPCDVTTLLPTDCISQNPCEINATEIVLPDGTVCEPCVGEPVNCSMTDQVYTEPCDDANALTENDIVTKLSCDDSVCVPCEGTAITPDSTRIFLPNFIQFDGQNENFGVYSGAPVLIDAFSIYDRWGEAVFSASSIMSDDPMAFWDGRFNDRKVEQGVYVYRIVFNPVHGLLNEVGTITVVR